jgi:hypothetical protein
VKRISTPRPVSPRQHYRSRRWFFLVAIVAPLLVGCANRSRAVRIAELDATCVPPAGWKLERSDQAARHAQRVWVSPTGKTSYGVIHFTMPLPLGNSVALSGFLSELKRNEGDARLISKTKLDNGLAFVAEGGRYHVNGIILTRGSAGWAIYAGTMRKGPVALDEIPLAVQARDSTIPGVSSGH